MAEGEGTPSERRARLAREAEERDRARLAGDLLSAWLGTCGALLAGEEARIKAEMAQQDPEYNFSFLKIAEIVGIAPDSTICL